MNKLEMAVMFAVQRHAGQLRKGTDVPYIVHPLATMDILRSMKADADLMIAGLLHDTIEDTGTTREEIAGLFGEDVAALVSGHSEDKSLPWEERKTIALNALYQAPQRLKMLVMADKTANLRDIVADYQTLGEPFWDRFNASRAQLAWYYSCSLDALADMQNIPACRAVYWEMTDLFKDAFVYYYRWQDTLYQYCVSGEGYFLPKNSVVWQDLLSSIPAWAERITRQEAEWQEDIWQYLPDDMTK